MAYCTGNPDPSLRQAQKCGRLKLLMESKIPFDNWIFNDIDINKQ